MGVDMRYPARLAGGSQMFVGPGLAQLDDPGAHLGDIAVHHAVARRMQSEDRDRPALRLKRKDLVENEGLRKLGEALDEDRKGLAHHGLAPLAAPANALGRLFFRRWPQMLERPSNFSDAIRAG